MAPNIRNLFLSIWTGFVLCSCGNASIIPLLGDCVNSNNTDKTIDIAVVLDLRTNILPNDHNLITFEMSKAFLFGGIKSSWRCEYGSKNTRFCLFGYTEANTSLLESCTSNPTFLLDYYASHTGNTSGINILDFIHVGTENSTYGHASNTIEDAALAAIDHLNEESLSTDTKKLIITLFQDDLENNTINQDICQGKFPLNCIIEMNQMYHILVHFSDNNTNISSTTADAIDCLNANTKLEQYGINKNNYYLANITEIIIENYINFQSSMFELANNFHTFYETNTTASYVSFQDISTKFMPVYLSSSAYGQFDDFVWLIAGNITFKDDGNFTNDTTAITTTENPAAFICPVNECTSNPCGCSEVENCKICHNGQGCSQCDQYHFRTENGGSCFHCQTVFGDNCVHCGDFQGCQQCVQGVQRLYDSDCGLWYCEDPSSTLRRVLAASTNKEQINMYHNDNEIKVDEQNHSKMNEKIGKMEYTDHKLNSKTKSQLTFSEISKHTEHSDQLVGYDSNRRQHLRQLLGRRQTSSQDTNVSAVAIDTSTSDTVIVSDATSENVEVSSAGDSSTSDHISFPGSFYQFSISEGKQLQRKNYPFSEIKNPCIVSDNDYRIFLIGGYDNATFDAANVTQQYDELTGNWTILPEMNSKRVFHGCHYFDDIIIVFGGCGHDVGCIDNANGIADEYFDTIEYLDLNNLQNGWIDVENIYLNNIRLGARSVTDLNNNIWIVGGFNTTDTIKSIEMLYVIRNGTGGSDVSFGATNNVTELIVGRAEMAFGQKSFDDSGLSCISVVGGKFGQNVESFDELIVLDNIEFVCYRTPQLCDDVPQCNDDPCDCDEVENCRICHPNGCDECESGYFKKDYDYHCVQCQEVFGTDCMHCADFHGCQQCATGVRTFDYDCGLWYCKDEE